MPAARACSLFAAAAALWAAALALPPTGGPYTIRLLQQESVLVVGDQPPPPPPPPHPLRDVLSTMLRYLPIWTDQHRPPVVEGLEGPLMDRFTTTTAATTTSNSTRKGILSFINAPDRPCPGNQRRDVTGQCREPW
ncbi:uncharacterized protein LOC126237478 [Schistocerca nitens]|uniref:uncharacterized protein LOC126237478 n=1 Tax=Schistocerca nitens TaxID=7011 RepID=UPI0021173D8D|nr:uncharacterized protein LOC126237478 [Schistocerca nitens]